VSDVSTTFQFPFGQSAAALGVGGGGMFGANVIWPLRGVIFSAGPVTFWLTTGCPGATLPPLFWQTYVALTESAVRKATVGPFPSPAAFPLQVSPALSDFVQDGVPTKCAFWASAAVVGTAIAATSAAANKMPREIVRIEIYAPLEKLKLIDGDKVSRRWVGREPVVPSGHVWPQTLAKAGLGGVFPREELWS
jgi:hypothetical protein